MVLKLDVEEEEEDELLSLFPNSRLSGDGFNSSGIMAIVRELSSYDFILGPKDSIQEAINRLPPDGGKIFLQKGEYQIRTQITIDIENVEIVGAGETTILYPYDSIGNKPAVLINASKTKIKNLKITSERLTLEDDGVSGGFRASAAKNDCLFDGLYCKDSDDRWTAVDESISLDSGSSNNTIRDCIFDDSGIVIVGEKNRIIENKFINGTGIIIFVNGHYQLITGNIIEAGYINCVKNGSVISNNILLDAGRSIWLGGANDCSVVGNTLPAGGDFDLDGADRNAIVGNAATGGSIDFNAISDENVLTGNVIRGGVTDAGAGNIDSGNNKA